MPGAILRCLPHASLHLLTESYLDAGHVHTCAAVVTHDIVGIGEGGIHVWATRRATGQLESSAAKWDRYKTSNIFFCAGQCVAEKKEIATAPYNEGGGGGACTSCCAA